jgi:hypothetical protein
MSLLSFEHASLVLDTLSCSCFTVISLGRGGQSAVDYFRRDAIPRFICNGWMPYVQV